MKRHSLALRCSLIVYVTAILGLLLSTEAQAQKFDIKAVAEKKVSQLPPGPLFWRVDAFPSLAKAQAVASSTALAAEVAGRAWLFTLGPPGGSSPGGNKVAEVGRPTRSRSGRIFHEHDRPPRSLEPLLGHLHRPVRRMSGHGLTGRIRLTPSGVCLAGSPPIT